MPAAKMDTEEEETRMSRNQADGAGRLNAPEAASAGADSGGGDQRRPAENFSQHHGNNAGGSDGSRKRRRRQRSQRGKRHGGPSLGRPIHLDVVSRERIFQEVEGLLRQIREQAEEFATWPEGELTEITQAVTSFTRYLDEQSDPISERVRSEYLRIRDKLSQALKADGRRAE